MRAIVASKYGPPEVLTYIDLPDPPITATQLLIKIKATAVNSGDGRLRSLDASMPLRLVMRILMGWSRLRQPILGVVYAGVVEEVGNQVTNFKVGQRVFGHLGMKSGSYAEKIAVEANSIVIQMPDKMTFSEAASIPFGALTAQYFLNKVDISPGQSVMVYGAAGAVGSMAVQTLKNKGAFVTAVARQRHHDFLLNIVANRVLDYQSPNFATDTTTYDIIFDAVGKIDKKLAKKKLQGKGKFLTVGGLDVAKESLADLEEVVSWYENEQLKAVIDKEYDFDDIVAAHHYLDTHSKQGNFILLIK